MAKMKINFRYTAADITYENITESLRLRPVDRLEKNELAVWDRLAPLLAAHDYLNDLFVDTLVEYCRVVCEINDIVVYLREHGKTYSTETRNGLQLKSRPEVGQLNELRRMLRSYVSDFGLSPAARKQLESVQMDMFENDLLEKNPFITNEAIYAFHSEKISH